MSVAVIGAGAAGASAAYHLSRYASDASIPINITVFERNSYIGGRSTTVNVYNDSSLPVELGASIFVEVNQILVDAVKTFNLSTSAYKADTPSTLRAPSLGVWNGREFVVTMSSTGPTWWDTAKLLWKYRLAPITTMRLMKSTVGKFLKMYDTPVFPFESLTEATHDVDLLDATSTTGKQYLSDGGVSESFAQDIIQASTRVNYAQNLPHIHGLETMVCMATDGAMSVEGGNWRIFEHMLAAANANVLLDTEVTDVERLNNHTYVVKSQSSLGDRPEALLTSRFDAVILAAPFQFSDIAFRPSLSPPPDAIPYVQLHVTLFTSPHPLSPAFFGLPKEQLAPLVVLTTLPQGEPSRPGPESVGSPGFFSISTLSAVLNPDTGNPEFLYKIFSPSPPNATWIASLLGADLAKDGGVHECDISWIYRKVWHSYPYETPRDRFEELHLEENLWYTGGMESFISTMETNALMGKNVAALLIAKRLSKERLMNASLPATADLR